MRNAILTLAALLFALPAASQVYRQVDKDGNVTFTDNPAADAEPVEIRELNTIAPPPELAPRPESTVPKQPATVGYEVSITAPTNDTVIPRGPGNFSVAASLSPALKSGHQLQLLLDGNPRQEPQTGTTWALTNVFRGTHALEVAVIDEAGNQLAKSQPITVYVFRPSSNFRKN
jgi:hypothetical protein